MVTLRLFGGLAVDRSGAPITGPGAQRRRLAVLALLAGRRETGLSRAKLLGFLWPEADEERGRHLLSNALYALRQALGPDVILGNGGDALRLNPDRLRVDIWEFRDALERNDPELAAALYTGPFLDGFFLSGAPEFERWSEGERAELSRLQADVLEKLAEEREVAGDFVAAAEWWRRLAAHDPYRSVVALRLMKALAGSGDRAAALQHAAMHETMLREDLGLEPDAEIAWFAEELRTESPRARPAGPDPRTPAEQGGSAGSRSPLAARARRPPAPGARQHLDPLSHAISGSLARVHYYRGDHDRAIREFRSTLAKLARDLVADRRDRHGLSGSGTSWSGARGAGRSVR